MSSNPNDKETARLLSEGQAAARRGDRAMARALLTQLVEVAPRNEEAWMWLSGVVTDLQEQQICLENVLVINPHNAHARKGLEFVAVKTGTPPRVPLPQPEQAEPAAQPPIEAAPPAMPAAPMEPMAPMVPTFPAAPVPQTHLLDAAPFSVSGAMTPTPTTGQIVGPITDNDLPPWMQAQPEFSMPQAANDAPLNNATLAAPMGGDPFAGTAPADMSAGVSPEASNGHSSYPSVPSGVELAATTPYTAPEPAPTDVPFSPFPAMPQTSSDEFVPWDMTQAHSVMDLETSGGTGINIGTNFAAATPPPGVDLSGFTPESVDRHEAAFRLDLDDAPFVPPGLDHLPEAHEDTATDLPRWLEGLTPSVPVSAEPAQPQDQFSPYNMSDFGGQPNYGQQPQGDYGQQPFNMQPDYSQQPDNVFNPAAMMGGQGGQGDMGPMGPYGEMQLPNPHDLPGGQDGLSSSSGFGSGPGYNQPQGQSGQPWYLQPSGSSSTATAAAPGGQGNKSYAESSMLSSAMLSSTMLTSTMVEEQRGGKPVATIPCPNCTQQVPETSLACPQCRYSFFVNCPLCHELVDTSDAKAGQTEACPYCKQTINKMEMGMGGVSDLVSQKNPGSRPAAANAMAYPSMQQTASPSPAVAGGLSFNWVVDLMWLCVVVLIVWALTQLPTWLNLPGMY